MAAHTGVQLHGNTDQSTLWATLEDLDLMRNSRASRAGTVITGGPVQRKTCHFVLAIDVSKM